MPPGPASGAVSGSPERRGKTSGRNDTTWETWWEMNRFEFLASRRHRAAVTRSAGGAGAEDPGVSPEVLAAVRSALDALRSDRDATVRDAATIASARLVASAPDRERLRRGLVATLETDPTVPAARAAAAGLEYAAGAEDVPFLARSADRRDWPCGIRTSLALSMPAVTDVPGIFDRTLANALAEKRKGCAVHVAMAAVLATGEARGPGARRTLEGILGDRGELPELRALAATALAHGGTRNVDLLLASRDDRDADVRRAVVLGLGILGWRTPADAAIAEVRDGHAEGSAISDVEAARLRDLESVAATERQAIEPALRATVKHLSTALTADDDAFVRAMAAISLGRIAGETGSALALRALERDLSHGDQREFDLPALALARAPAALDAAAPHVGNPKARPTTRGAAAIALGLTGDPRGRSVLREALRTETHPTVRGYVALGLGMLGDVDARPRIREMVERGRSERGVAYAALGLALMGTHADAEVLVRRLATSSDAVLSPNLVHALRILGDASAASLLIEVAKDPGSPGRSWAVAALGHVGEASPVLPRRIAMARGFDYLVRGADALTPYFFGD